MMFDGQYFDYDSACKYTLLRDNCGNFSQQPNFEVIVKNELKSSGSRVARVIVKAFNKVSELVTGKKRTTEHLLCRSMN